MSDSEDLRKRRFVQLSETEGLTLSN